MRESFINTLDKLMGKDGKLITITADMGYSVFEGIRDKYKERFINTGVTEQASTSFATGLALTGHKVFYYAQAIFITTRCYEQMRLDVAYNHADIKMIGSNGGLSLSQYGLSHFAVEDIGIMRLLSGMNILTPGDPYEMEWAMNEAYKIQGPVYIRFTKTGGKPVHEKKLKLKVGDQIRITKGKHGSIFVSGSLLNMAQEVVSNLENVGLSLSLYSAPSIKPFDSKYVIEEAKIGPIFTMEEHCINGGLGTVISEIIAENGISVKLKRFGLPDKYTSITGSIDYLLGYNGLSAEKISEGIIKVIKKQ